MLEPQPNTRPHVRFWFWPFYLLIQLGLHLDYRDLLEKDFWISFAICLGGAFAAAAIIVGGCFAYYRFCRWFNRGIETARAKSLERIALREGILTWPTSDPLHDQELDDATRFGDCGQTA